MPFVSAIVSEVLKLMPSTVSDKIYGFSFIALMALLPNSLWILTAKLVERLYCWQNIIMLCIDCTSKKDSPICFARVLEIPLISESSSGEVNKIFKLSQPKWSTIFFAVASFIP